MLERQAQLTRPHVLTASSQLGQEHSPFSCTFCGACVLLLHAGTCCIQRSRPILQHLVVVAQDCSKAAQLCCACTPALRLAPPLCTLAAALDEGGLLARSCCCLQALLTHTHSCSFGSIQQGKQMRVQLLLLSRMCSGGVFTSCLQELLDVAVQLLQAVRLCAAADLSSDLFASFTAVARAAIAVRTLLRPWHTAGREGS